ncbi:MAG: hypothetical protein ACYTHK_05995 [Planctomycetota bacterium]|jgi:hypothetical protein
MRILLPLLFVASMAAAGEKITWYGTWERAKADAARLNRPILLLSAAPQCRNVPGKW